ncbi:hypothetical protein O1611_g3633 [Lasiodiplodia mahajangana]|uniref:Uncharacterized protein n=1 Tax=Lasiodiplodia mahajangana TaxID=1108764 RepID=A0ACC2JS18_9PEZI|nr:hypothetical protein O1611_g3633 [Lasiodiplodia mahajangana]
MSGTPHTYDGTSSDLPGWTREDYPSELQPPIHIHDYGIRVKNDKFGLPFYPLKLLEHIFKRAVWHAEINGLVGLNDTDKRLLYEKVLGSRSRVTETYIQIFAILKAIGQPNKLPLFVRASVSDQQLPLSHADANFLSRNGSDTLLLDEFVARSGPHLFVLQQNHMVVPFFGNQPEPYNFTWTDIIPYVEVPRVQDATKSDELSGSSGSVTKIRIHPFCHAYHDAVKPFKGSGDEIFFALKRFHDHDTTFEREVKALRRFNEAGHPHIAPLLAAFTSKHGRFLIFPWATHDLRMYWEVVQPNPNPSDAGLVQWVCRQAGRLVQAVSKIHALPEDVGMHEQKDRCGRHGDLKPENILWYGSRPGCGKLVITDMGLSKLHRYISKSYTIHGKVIASPRYRPPELTYEGGHMGQQFDIWTLGCIFLEMMCWLHGGYKQLQEMEIMITGPSIRSANADTDEYYEWVEVESKGTKFYTVRVKEVVTKYIHTLRKSCSPFARDLLDIIEDYMLVVDREERAAAKDLWGMMKGLDTKCKDLEYCTPKIEHKVRGPRKPKLQKMEVSKSQTFAGLHNIRGVSSSAFREDGCKLQI